MPTIEDAILLAVRAHKGQKDKGGAPYILHALRVMLQMDSTEEMMAAVLHDIIEDTPVREADLMAEGYPREVVEAVKCLTKIEGEPYIRFVERVKPNAIARKVKISDIKDNMNLARIPAVKEEDIQRIQKYKAALKELVGY